MSEAAATFGFSVNHSEAGGFDVLPNGKYEAVVTQVDIKDGEKAFKSGSIGMNVTLTIRNDVEQAGAKRKVFDTLVAVPAAMFKFQQYAKAVGISEGAFISSLPAFAKEILYKPVKITLGTDTYLKDGEQVQKNVVKNCEPSDIPYAGGSPDGSADPFANSETAVDVSGEDFPF